MDSKEFSKRSVTGYDAEQVGDVLYMKGFYPLPDKVDFSDENSVNAMVPKAIQTAEGFYQLIKTNCNTLEPNVSSDGRLEMYFALAGLTCEIYMKSILYFEKKHGGKKCLEHRLNELFKRLPDYYKDAIRDKIETIEIELPKIGTVFETLRYDYELNSIQGNYFLVFDLMEELRIICDSLPKETVGEVRSANGKLCLE